MIEFYCPDIEIQKKLSKEESLHCSRVLRKRDGDEIQVVDGKGYRYFCKITDSKAKEISVEIIKKEKERERRDYKMILAIAPTKNIDRIEWMVEKCIEIGIDGFAFVNCDRSERKRINIDRLKRIAVSAMKQCLSAYLPEMEEYSSLNEFLQNYKENGLKYIGYCSDKIEKNNYAKELLPKRDVIVIIGPEGDFTEKEVEDCMKAGFKPVTFGESRLRTETAGLYAVTAVSVINEASK